MYTYMYIYKDTYVFMYLLCIQGGFRALRGKTKDARYNLPDTLNRFLPYTPEALNRVLGV